MAVIVEIIPAFLLFGHRGFLEGISRPQVQSECSCFVCSKLQAEPGDDGVFERDADEVGVELRRDLDEEGEEPGQAEIDIDCRGNRKLGPIVPGQIGGDQETLPRTIRTARPDLVGGIKNILADGEPYHDPWVAHAHPAVRQIEKSVGGGLHCQVELAAIGKAEAQVRSGRE